MKLADMALLFIILGIIILLAACYYLWQQQTHLNREIKSIQYKIQLAPQVSPTQQPPVVSQPHFTVSPTSTQPNEKQMNRQPPSFPSNDDGPSPLMENICKQISTFFPFMAERQDYAEEEESTDEEEEDDNSESSEEEEEEEEETTSDDGEEDEPELNDKDNELLNGIEDELQRMKNEDVNHNVVYINDGNVVNEEGLIEVVLDDIPNSTNTQEYEIEEINEMDLDVSEIVPDDLVVDVQEKPNDNQETVVFIQMTSSPMVEQFPVENKHEIQEVSALVAECYGYKKNDPETNRKMFEMKKRPQLISMCEELGLIHQVNRNYASKPDLIAVLLNYIEQLS